MVRASVKHKRCLGRRLPLVLPRVCPCAPAGPSSLTAKAESKEGHGRARLFLCTRVCVCVCVCVCKDCQLLLKTQTWFTLDLPRQWRRQPAHGGLWVTGPAAQESEMCTRTTGDSAASASTSECAWQDLALAFFSRCSRIMCLQSVLLCHRRAAMPPRPGLPPRPQLQLS